MNGKRRGQFITFEGIEGCGKSTQIKRLKQHLEGMGLACQLHKEPGHTDIGKKIRAVLLDPDHHHMEPWTEALLYLADRIQNMNQAVKPALDSGVWVLQDRSHDSTRVYQGVVRNLGVDRLDNILGWGCPDFSPDLTILIDMDPEHALNRARDRNASCQVAAKEGRFEVYPLDFHRQTRQAFLDLQSMNPERIRIVSGEGDEDTVFERILDTVEARTSYV